MGRKGKHWRATLIAEDGSVLKVIGIRPEHVSAMTGGVAHFEAQRLASQNRKRERDEARAEARDIRETFGLVLR